MATSVGEIVDRALALSVANQGLPVNQAILIDRINRYQRQRWTQYVQANRTAYQMTTTQATTSGNGQRVCDLSTLTKKVERVISVKLPSGTDVRPVDLQDVDAELAPRYYPSGETLVEVGADWNPVSLAAVTLTIAYVWRPDDLDTGGTTTQLVSIPDGYVGMLVDQLGASFAASDVGRDPGESESLMKQSDATAAAWIAHGASLAGPSAYRFHYPTPLPGEQA